ncbi:acid phosphatase/Vanadium-dependent haloperoxidase [Xylaria bambusicola]|uniref:acid phosphatase/Vanadium-dependent haloperoxidase n=1 Tax=Xylaria bambusicola TaxID=326684 RepID=UPI00200862BA|nr:acid phosphatase/Vanadium-dependent haloperoxidase [Xylaria bambusicola]KAI0508512.1 acid phosphatase/Vanadium-dependent haloperoxidase [Xylaria bambusicola]
MPDMDMLPPRTRPKKMSVVVILSYAFDWLIMVVVGLIGYFLGEVTPNKRPFSLLDPNIAFPVTQHETVNSGLLLALNSGVPIVIILVVALVFVPGRTVPEGTPKSLIWKRKLWELHMGWLGLALSLISAWIITQGMKNLFGKPRPDLLDRCMPDVANVTAHIVGFTSPLLGTNPGSKYNGQLVSATICTNSDKAFLDDGFRSYPSGHASSAAAGLIYLSFFLASKFAITFPFVPQETIARDSSAVTAFPSRLARRTGAGASLSADTAYEGMRSRSVSAVDDDVSSPLDPAVMKQIGVHNSTVAAVRRQAAAPPVYLLLLAVLPFFLAVFIASSRWFDFRHHGFDILFGFIIGTITAYFSFQYYHMPIRAGGGWAWGPRSHDKAFWAGLGSWSYASDKRHWLRNDDGEEMQRPYMSGQDIELGGLRQRGASPVAKPGDVRTYHVNRDEGSRTTLEPQESERI